jgi:hypothetical protein
LGIWVGADALIIPPEVTQLATERLARESGLAREQLYLSATHTHASLGGWGEGVVAESFAGGFQPGTRVWFANCIAEAVQTAIKDLKPARFGRGSFAAPEFVRNRLVGSLGRVDPEFSFAVFEQAGGATCVLGVFSAHATILSGDFMEFSGDYPGAWQRAVESAGSGTAIFLAGGVGSHSPVPGERGIAGVKRMGTELAHRLGAALPRIPLTNQVTFGMMGLDVVMPPLNVRITDGLRLRPWVASRLLPPRRDSFVQVFRIADTVWISTPCDFSGELALDLKDFLRARGREAVVTSFNGDYVGYVIPCRYYHMNGYEPRVMNFFGPNVTPYLDEMIRSMALAMAR